jgi:hypothetical protein
MAVFVDGDYWKIINKYNGLIGKKADFPIRKSENQKRRSATFAPLPGFLSRPRMPTMPNGFATARAEPRDDGTPANSKTNPGATPAVPCRTSHPVRHEFQ